MDGNKQVYAINGGHKTSPTLNYELPRPNMDLDPPGRCHRMCGVFKPCLASSHPLPHRPSLMRTVGQWFLCPPSGKVAAAMLMLLMAAVWWTMLVTITKNDKGNESLPGGKIFPLMVLFIGSWIGGYVIKPTTLPPLLGMIVVGVILGNVPGIDVAKQIDPVWSATARSMALTVILTKAGLGLDPVALRRLSLVVLRLAFCPSIAEAVVDGVAAHFILGFDWTWSFLLAFVMSVVSPAVVVPSMLGLSDRGYGVDQGIPTLVVAACSLDAVLAITGFGVMLSIVFSEGDIVWTLIKGPLEAVVGIVVGSLGGLILWYLPQKSSKNLVLFRSLMLIGGGMLTIFGAKALRWSGSGPLGCLSLAFVAAYGWRKEYVNAGIKNPVENVTGVMWMFFQPLLFGLIGSAVDISSLDSNTVGYGVAVLFMGLTVRCCVSFLTVMGTDLNLKERFFIPCAWFPKATVQAAIGAIAYDTAIDKGATDLIPLGKKVLTLAVLAILITAPIGSAIIALVGPRLLHKTDEDEGVADHGNSRGYDNGSSRGCENGSGRGYDNGSSRGYDNAAMEVHDEQGNIKAIDPSTKL